MICMTREIRTAVLVGSAAILFACSARADTPSPITVSGFLDLYYQYDFNRPPVGITVGGRQFDIKHNSFSLPWRR